MTRFARAASMSLLATLFACSSASEEGSSAADSAPSVEETGSDATPADDAVVADTAKAPDAPSEVGTDTGAACGKAGQACCAGSTCDKGLGCNSGSKTCVACAVNFCVTNGYTNGWYCDGSGTNVQCQLDSSTRCPRAYPEPCPTGVTCSSTTGTCGGCDPADACFRSSDGTRLCLSGKGAPTGALCKKQPDGCMKATEVTTCSYMCVAGSGCCGNTGDRCCKATTPSCKSGLTCSSAGTCG